MTAMTAGRATATVRSMTGFGRAAGAVDGWGVVVEVKSVNHKGLDVKLRVPRALLADEPSLVAQVRSRVERGRVDVVVDLTAPDSEDGIVDLVRVAAVVGAARAIAERFPVVEGRLDVADVLRVPGVIAETGAPSTAGLSTTTALLLGAALDALQAARTLEGEGLRRDLQGRRERCGALVEDIGRRTATAVADKRARLQERLQVLLGEHLEPARLAAEVAVLAERVDVAEELARLRLHLEHLDTLLSSTSPGRKIDFLCQELMREANTTASKCQDAETARCVVDLKAEIERLREQAQNIE
jgi:uncharacterized protein (TIGR00255 family)